MFKKSKIYRKTPVTEYGLQKFDHLPAHEAVLKAWVDSGANHAWHEQQRGVVEDVMPLLARALKRMALEKTDD